ncbi:ArsR/SmtB family transcription factor [Saccharomonospora xinjiangensis]|uniref:Putative transcriptional regulator n=1 Tax=Saccharomonospora xinjiangensis XJ-54 TaxID=882086 RepID=I0V7M2_9PSEU|nr:helix-turn-helix domain-containing protein [Saccharomonospora xinjiangensis]EID56125.1 putative transcriptional regulator [Saccharomonospora xinjiangensis XJ-54]
MPDTEGHPDVAEMTLQAVLGALADPLRRKVIRDLVNDQPWAERTCVSFELGVSKSTLTHHFRVLRESGLVYQVNRGNSRKVTLRRHDIESRFPGLLALIAEEA